MKHVLQAAAAASALAMTAFGQNPMRPVPLFAHLPSLTDPHVATSETIQRGIPVQLNTQLLYAARVGDRLSFPAFDGEVFDLRLESRTEVVAVPGAFQWRISIDGDPESMGGITVVGDAVSAWLAPGDHRAQTIVLQPAPGGMECLRELENKNEWCGCGQSHAPELPQSLPTLHVPSAPQRTRRSAPLGSGRNAMASNSTPSCSGNAAVISVLCVYNPAAESQSGGTNGVISTILGGLQQSSGVLGMGGINMRMAAADIIPTSDYNPNATMQDEIWSLRSPTDGRMDEVHGLRRQLEADLVNLTVGEESAHGYVRGIANYPVADHHFTPSSGFSVQEVLSVLDMAMVHEFGHNFGCGHDSANASASRWREYNYGWQQQIVDTLFVKRWLISVMGYHPNASCPFPATCSATRGVSFTGPNVQINLDIGTYTMGSATADNIRVIEESRYLVADYGLQLNGLPRIVTQPRSRLACPGPQSGGPLFSCFGENTCDYEWWALNDQVRRWESTGQTGPDFVLANVTSSDFGRYRCLLRNALGDVNTVEVSLVDGSGLAIRTQPADRHIPAGTQPDPNVLAVVADNAAGYQWMKQAADGTFLPMNGQNGSSLSISLAGRADAGAYRCRVSGNCGELLSSVANLSVGDFGREELYGQGCGDLGGTLPKTFYDLVSGGVDLERRSLRFVPSVNGYEVSECIPSCFDSQAVQGRLNLGNDELARGLALGFDFPLASGGTTSSIDVDSNGMVGLVVNQLSGSDGTPTVAEFLSGAEKIAAFWSDFDASTSGNVFFHTDSNRAYVTWNNIAGPIGVGRNTCQLQLVRNGEFILSYYRMGNPDGLVGYSEGGGVADPGATDLSSLSRTPATLRTFNSPPTVGDFVNMLGTSPPNAREGILDVGFERRALDLSSFGPIGCSVLTSRDVQFPVLTYNAGGVGNGNYRLNFPDDPNLAGLTLHAQMVFLVPGANSAGFVTTNGVSLTLGILR